MALAFWTLRRDFDVAWWAPNVVLLAYPLAFCGVVMRAWAAAHAPTSTPPTT